MKPKKIALVGGAGFIGHNLAISLKNRGHEAIVIDSLAVNNILSFTDGDIKNRKLYSSILNQRMDLMHDNDVEISIEDARDYNSMSMLLGKYNPDVIIQLAAVSHANKSNKDPHTTFDHTLRTLENTLDIARTLGSHVIYLSSSMVYGHFHGKTVTEDSQCNPLGIYDTLKYSGEQIVKAYHRVFKTPYTIIRPSALYGERCVSRRVSQIFIENAVQGLDISINGDGSDKLDFTYIEDFVHGVTLAVENENSINETFNMTYGEARTIGDMADILKKHFDGINISYTPKDSLTPDRGTLSVDKARDLLGYKPQNPIDLGYPKYIEWYKGLWAQLKS
mgnify:FL=1